jgi:hypothetical protein
VPGRVVQSTPVEQQRTATETFEVVHDLTRKLFGLHMAADRRALEFLQRADSTLTGRTPDLTHLACSWFLAQRSIVSLIEGRPRQTEREIAKADRQSPDAIPAMRPFPHPTDASTAPFAER